MKLKFSIITVFLIFPVFLFAGPFGLEMGMSLDELNSLDQSMKYLREDIYEITPPAPHPDFKYYYVWVDDDAGLYYLKATTEEKKSNSFGSEPKVLFSEIQKQISIKYGDGEITDLIMDGSTWDEDNQWYMSLYYKERFLFCQWSSETGAETGDEIVSVSLAVSATEYLKYIILIEYEFSNFEQVQLKNEAKEAELF